MRFDGQVLDEGTALVLDIWLDGVHTHFATGNAETAQGVVAAHQAVSAVGAQSWATFYSMLLVLTLRVDLGGDGLEAIRGLLPTLDRAP
ncbi:MAG TPA: hypothetical protein DCX12_02615 [Chloroflexi bacterium]|jgi:hypothetical protein|nr:hypothetical protein [Chloroflexota bacterium]HBV93877.1 hypothetical protein [Chloroflexota bacterium]